MVILNGEVGKDITLAKIVTLIDNGETEFYLNSHGGSLVEGFAIRDYLKNSSKEIIIRGIGMVASSATIILSSTKKRISLPSTKYVLHNPTTEVRGDATAIEKTVVDLRNYENEIAEIYASFGYATKEDFLDLMAKDKIISAKEALALGIITEIQDISNNVYKSEIQINNEHNMESNTVNKFMARISKLLGFKNYVAQAADGTTLDFGQDVTEESQIEVGSPCSAENGKYILPSGTSVTVEDNLVTEVTQDTSNAEQGGDVTELTNKVTELTAQIKDLTAAVDSKDAKLNEVESANEKLLGELQNAVKQFKDEQSKFSGGQKPEIVDNIAVDATKGASKRSKLLTIYNQTF